MHRADCEAHSSRRASALPMVILLADRFSRISAPASAAAVDGGCGTQTSSQISTWAVNGAVPCDWNSRSTPNGTLRSATLIAAPRIPEPDVH